MRFSSIYPFGKAALICMSSLFFSFVGGSFNNNASAVTQEMALEEACLPVCTVDGTQLVAETKALVAEYYATSVSNVIAAYIGQTSSGNYKYSYTALGTNTGWVEWHIIGSDDFEGYVIED